MNKEDFLREVHDYIDKRYLQFTHYQEIVIDILKEFDRVCKDAGIEYILSYGNLLGAVRDNCQIPWDYDVDVVLSYEDKNALINALNKSLPSLYYYCYNNNTPNYPTSCLRVSKVGCSWMALHIDVYFYIGLPDSINEQKIIQSTIERYDRIKHIRNLAFHVHEEDKRGCIRRIISKLAWHIRRLVYSGKELEKFLDEQIRKCPIATSEYILTVGEGAHVWKKDWFRPIEKEIEGYRYPIPNGYEEILSTEYKNYRVYLPIGTRFEEFYSMCKIVEERQAIYE